MRVAVLLAAALMALAHGGQASAIGQAGDLILEAKERLARGDAIAAEARIKAAIARGAPRKAVAAYMGEALLAQGQFRRARSWLEPGVFSPATESVGFRALALLERKEGDLRAAGMAYDRALAATPGDAALWVEVARLRYAGGEHLLAIEASDYALKLDPDHPKALELHGQFVRDRTGLAAALPWFSKAHERAPDDLSILGEYAATAGDLGRVKLMLRLTRRMLELDPGNPRAFYLQAVMAARAGDFRLGRVLMNKTQGRLKDTPGAMLLEGVLELGAGNHTLAVEVLERLVEEQPGNARARNLLARALFLAGEHKYLVDAFGALAKRPDADPYLQVVVARAFENLGMRDNAAALLDSAARPRRTAIRIVANGNRVGELLAVGRTGEARTLVQGWLAENPDYYDHLAWAGDVELASGQARAAMRYYARAARIRSPESLMERRFQAMLMAGETDRAATLVEGYLVANPESDSAMRLAGWLSALAGDWQRAQSLLGAVRANGGGHDIQLLSDLALAQLRSGDVDAAEATSAAGYRLQRSSPVAAQAWGLSLAASGTRKAEARALLDKARAIMGDNRLLAEGRRWLRTSGKG